ncbi:MAG TPA: hypothetical protein VH044_13345 [Polyangiaceae bacterium]|jgi:hypothetical protein|nr:hypothetical protein [Polyangiaceae bacterium]
MRASCSPVSPRAPVTPGVALFGALSAGLALVACESKLAAIDDAGPAASASAPAPASAAIEGGDSGPSPGEHMAHWDDARTAALHIPCRAIAVDGHVHLEVSDAGVDGGPGAAAGALASQGEIPEGPWIALAADSRLVAKDPRTTRETTFLGPARVRACVEHREESWVASGRFESSIGAGETPGAEEWVVTGLGVVRYMAAKASVQAETTDGALQVLSGVAFLWLPEDVEIVALAGAKGADAAAAPALDDDGWLRIEAGITRLKRVAPLDAFVRARRAVEHCVSSTRRSQELAAELFAGAASMDAGTAKDQVRTRRLARAACDVADLRVDTLPPSAPRGELSMRLGDAGAPPTMKVPSPLFPAPVLPQPPSAPPPSPSASP